MTGGLNMETKDIKCEFTYQCGICGKSYKNILDRAHCEIKCAEQAEIEAKKAAEAKKKEEQKTRKAEVDEAFKILHKLVTAYVKDYGLYEYGDGGEETNFHWPSRVWSNFWN